MILVAICTGLPLVCAYLIAPVMRTQSVDKLLVSYVNSLPYANAFFEFVKKKDSLSICFFVWMFTSTSIFFLRHKQLEKFDHFIFAKYNTDFLEQIKYVTGMFKWTGANDTSLLATYDEIIKWVKSSEVNGKWSFIKFDHNKIETPFSWSLLCGPSGVGKSQMSQEIGRVLGRRDKFGDRSEKLPFGRRIILLCRRMHCWIRRVTPWCILSSDDPWDVGIVKHMQQNALSQKIKEWRPRMPTFIIIDSPPIGLSKEIINTFYEVSESFRHPVRLLIVDQFIMPEIGINYSCGQWHQSSPVEATIEVHTINFFFSSVKQLHSIIRYGYFDIDRERRTPLIKRLSTVKSLFAEEDLMLLLRMTEGNPLLIALTFLILASNDVKSINNLSDDDYIGETLGNNKVKPSTDQEKIERFRRNVLKRNVIKIFENIISLEKEFANKSATTKPYPLVKSVACATIADGLKYSLSKELYTLDMASNNMRKIFAYAQDAVEKIQPINPSIIGEGFVLHFFYSILENDVEAQNKLLLQAIEVHPEASLRWLFRAGPLQRHIIKVVSSMQNHIIPEQSTLLFESSAYYCMYYNRDSIPTALRFIPLLGIDYISNWIDRFNAIQRANITASSTADTFCLFSLAVSLADRQFLQNNISAIEINESIVYLRRLIDREWSGVPEPAGSEDTIIEKIQALEKLCANNDEIQEIIALTWANFAKLWSCIPQLKTKTVDAIKTVHAIAKKHDNNTDIQRALAWVWVRAATVWYEIPAHIEKVFCALKQVKNIANKHSENEDIQRALVWAWYCSAQACSCMEKYRYKTFESLAPICNIAKKYSNNEDISHILAWTHKCIAYAWSRTPHNREKSFDSLEQVQDIAIRYSDNENLQRALAWTWNSVAHSWSMIPTYREKTISALKPVQDIANKYANNEDLQRALACTWKDIAYSWSMMPTHREKTISALKPVQDIANKYANNEKIQEVLACTWKDIAYSWSMMPTHREKTISALKPVQDIANKYANNENIQEVLACTWKNIAYSWSMMPTHREKTISALKPVQDIANKYADNEDIQEALAWTWKSVAYSWDMMPTHKRQLVNALKQIQRIANQYSDNVNINLALVTTLSDINYFWSLELRHSEEIIKALEDVKSITSRYTGNPEFVEALTKILSFSS
jgi:hypothetical protein